VAIDYLTKWEEAMPTFDNKENIVARFSVIRRKKINKFRSII